jgi:hypothetical protein
MIKHTFILFRINGLSRNNLFVGLPIVSNHLIQDFEWQ